MNPRTTRGMTLVELLLAVAIVGMIAAASSALLRTTLRSHAAGGARRGLHAEALAVMGRVTGTLRMTTMVFIPNARRSNSSLLAVAGIVNPDGDSYFGDPLFPRIAEEIWSDVVWDGRNGLKNIDDDGDGQVDESGAANVGDDDEDGLADEDPIDGLDNDGDGDIDEDPGNDATNDGATGIAGRDDDGDGATDEGSGTDDDEDGTINDWEVLPVLYVFDSAAGTLAETWPLAGTTTILGRQVTDFRVRRQAPGLFEVTITMCDATGDTLSLTEYVYQRNLRQSAGKWVR